MPEQLPSVDLGPWLEGAPAMLPVVLVALVFVGVLLWLFGGVMARGGCVLAGLVLGGLGAATLAVSATGQGQASWVAGIGIGGAIAGGLVAFLLFRMWIGLTTAAVLALVVPIAVLVWTGQRPDTTATTQAATATREVAAELVSKSTLVQDMADAATAEAASLLETLRSAWSAQVESVKAWWSALEGGTRSVVVGGAMVGGFVGLMLGMVLPGPAAALQTALAGAVLMFFAGRVLLVHYVGVGETAFPATARGVLISVGLITLIGALLQWTVLRKDDDRRR